MTHPAPAPQVTVGPLRVTCIAADGAGASLLVQLLASLLPGLHIGAIDPLSVRTVPGADCAVLDLTANEAAVLQTMRSLRSRGFKALWSASRKTASPIMKMRWRDWGFRGRSRYRKLPRDCHERYWSPLNWTHSRWRRLEWRAPCSHSVRRNACWRLAKIATKMQHSLYSPLGALLAEAQLLELEDLSPERRRAVERIIELSRRLIEVTRTLEGIGSR